MRNRPAPRRSFPAPCRITTAPPSSACRVSGQRIDAGIGFGKNNEPAYLAMNPNGRVPTLVEGDFVLWESNSVMRYLALAYGKGSPIYPDAPKRRTSVDRWLDWTLSTMQ